MALAVGLGRPGADDAAAGCKKVGQSCARSGDCCDGSYCAGGACKCKRGLEDCDGRCKNLKKDEAHCGKCGNVCASNETCCFGGCIDLQSDPNNCGACLHKCDLGQACFGGTCVYV